MRLFAAIKPPDWVCRQLLTLQKGVSGARWTELEKLHITLGFFGEVEDALAEILDMELGRIHEAGFELSLEGVGHFGTKTPHALWAGVKESAALTDLHKQCKGAARRAGIALEKRRYTPHLTLAYLKREAAINRLIAFEKNGAAFKTKPFLVDRFYLLSSHVKKRGPNLYREEACYPLLGR